MDRMSTPRLTDTSYAVMGLLDQFEPATPYQLKQIAQVSIFHFWSIPHTQLYTECSRLADAGLLDERRRTDPQADLYELRDPGLLKLFCGADPAALAQAQLERHERRLHSYQELIDQADMPQGMRLSLESGIGHEREYVRFWSRLRDDGDRR
jgi:PadR family transcriptional regulator AphA